MTDDDKRKHKRYGAKFKVELNLGYDLETEIDYQLMDKKDDKVLPDVYSAMSKNISTEGMCIISEKKLELGDKVLLKVYKPYEEVPVKMIGEIRWSDLISEDEKNAGKFSSGIKIVSVEGKGVKETIRFDQKHNIHWSVLLQSVIGQYQILSDGANDDDSDES